MISFRKPIVIMPLIFVFGFAFWLRSEDLSPRHLVSFINGHGQPYTNLQQAVDVAAKSASSSNKVVIVVECMDTGEVQEWKYVLVNPEIDKFAIETNRAFFAETEEKGEKK